MKDFDIIPKDLALEMLAECRICLGKTSKDINLFESEASKFMRRQEVIDALSNTSNEDVEKYIDILGEEFCEKWLSLSELLYSLGGAYDEINEIIAGFKRLENVIDGTKYLTLYDSIFLLEIFKRVKEFNIHICSTLADNSELVREDMRPYFKKEV